MTRKLAWWTCLAATLLLLGPAHAQKGKTLPDKGTPRTGTSLQRAIDGVKPAIASPTPQVRPGRKCSAVVTLAWDASRIQGATGIRWEAKRGADFSVARGDDPRRAATGTGALRGSTTVDLRKYGPVLDGSPWYFRIVAQARGRDVAGRSRPATFQRSVEIPAGAFRVEADRSKPLHARLAVTALPREIAGCASGVTYQAKKGSGFSSTGQERGLAASGTLRGTRGAATLDLSRAGPGTYSFRIGARFGRSPVGVMSRSKGVRKLALSAPAPRRASPPTPPSTPELGTPQAVFASAFTPPPTMQAAGSCPAEIRYSWSLASTFPNADRVRWELKSSGDFTNSTGDEPGTLDRGNADPNDSIEIDLREHGPVLDGTRYYFRIVAQEDGDDLTPRSRSAVFGQTATYDGFTVSRSGVDEAFGLRLAWQLPGPIAACSNRSFYEVKRGPFSNLQGDEPGRLEADDVGGTSGNRDFDFDGDGAGDYYFRVVGMHDGDDEEDVVGLRGPGARVRLPTLAPAIELMLNQGQSRTYRPEVTLDFQHQLPAGYTGEATRYRAASRASSLPLGSTPLAGTPPRFPLPGQDGLHTVHFQVVTELDGHNATTPVTSEVASDTILLEIPRPAEISLQINAGDAATTSRAIMLDHRIEATGTGTPVAFRASQSRSRLRQNPWQAYQERPSYHLSDEPDGPKVVYLEIRSRFGKGADAIEVESLASDDILLAQNPAQIGVTRTQSGPPSVTEFALRSGGQDARVIDAGAPLQPRVRYEGYATHYRVGSCLSLNSAPWSPMPGGLEGNSLLPNVSLEAPGYHDYCVQLRLQAGAEDHLSNRGSVQINVVARVVHEVESAAEAMRLAQRVGFTHEAEALDEDSICTILPPGGGPLYIDGRCRFRLFAGGELADEWSTEAIDFEWAGVDVRVERSGSGRTPETVLLLEDRRTTPQSDFFATLGRLFTSSPVASGTPRVTMPLGPRLRVQLRGPAEDNWRAAFRSSTNR